MKKSNDNPRDQADWSDFERIFGGKLPFLDKEQGDFPESSTWIEKYMQEVMRKMVAQVGKTRSSQLTLDFDIFETHRSVIVRINLPADVHPRTLQIYVKSIHLFIEGLPDERRQTIKLPHRVIQQGRRAKFKDGILEIHLLKEIDRQNEKEIPIRIL